MPDLKTLAKEVLNDGYLVALGVHDAQGPWVASVIFLADDDMNLFWLSSEGTRHSKTIDADKHIAAMIVAEWKVDRERALQIEGTAEKVGTVLFEMEKALRAKQGKPLPTKPGETVKEGNSWYKLTPARIELIHNEQFGWDRKRVL
jgi:uncharacterized protein YhbP (UPF0306 family)